MLASLPSLQASLEVATGKDGVIEGARVKRFVDLSTVGSQMAVRIYGLLAKRNIVQIDSPVSGGVGGAEKGTLAVMVSGPRADFDAIKPALEVIGKVFFIGEKPGSGQTMKLANNLLSATAVVATSEAVVMGVKAGLDPAVMIDVINAGSGMNTASRDKFPRSILPRSFDFGFATGLMVKDVRLCLEEMKSLGLSMEVAEAVGPAVGSGDPRHGRGVGFHLRDQADRTGGGRGGGRNDGAGGGIRISCPGRSAARSLCEAVRCRAGAVTERSARDGPGSAERHEGCRTASGTPVTTTAPPCPSRSARRHRRADGPLRTGRP